MTRAYAIKINDYDGAVVSSMDLALRHVAQTVLRGPLDATFDLDRAIGTLTSEFEHLAQADMRPTLGQMLAATISNGFDFESLTIVEHDLETGPGLDSAQRHYDFTEKTPSAMLVATLRDLDIYTNVEDAAEALEFDLGAALSPGVRGSAAYIERLRAFETALSQGTTSPFSVVPETVEYPDAFLDRLPALAAERFRELATRLETAPTPL